MYGWMGKVIRVNLTDGKITKEPLEEELAHKYVGGRGFTIKHVYDELKPGIDPLGVENKLIFAPGPACGTGLSLDQLLFHCRCVCPCPVCSHYRYVPHFDRYTPYAYHAYTRCYT